LVNLAELKGIDVAIVVCPTDISYYSELDPGLVRTMNSSLEKFALRNKVDYYNYTADKRFFEEDFTVEMVDHMSGRGANKFSRIVDTEILSTRGN
jgi:predicted HD phosphohydrolase